MNPTRRLLWGGRQATGAPELDAAPLQAIELDSLGRPFIPATSIKGLIRNIAASTLPAGAEKSVDRLLGDIARERRLGGGSQAVGAIAEIRNAWQSGEIDPAKSSRPAIRGRTKLHRGSRTAEDGYLRHDRAVAPGARFDLEIILDRAELPDVTLLAALLERIDGSSSSSALGSGKTQGDGRIRFEGLAIGKVGAEELTRWLKAPENADWQDFASDVVVDTSSVKCLTSVERRTFPMSIQIAGSFLVSVANPKKSRPGEDNPEPSHLPFRLKAEEANIPLLPASSMDGALRSQAERIWRTISNDFREWDEASLPAPLEDLFGSSQRSSMLEIGHFVGAPQAPTDQDFVAIDRFTGGQMPGAKYKLRSFQRPCLKGELSVVLRRSVNQRLSGKAGNSADEAATIKPESIGLLALTLKDLACGDVTLGFATRKGYGDVSALHYGEGGWPELLNDLGSVVLSLEDDRIGAVSPQEAIQQAVRLLHKHAAIYTQEQVVVHGAR